MASRRRESFGSSGSVPSWYLMVAMVIFRGSLVYSLSLIQELTFYMNEKVFFTSVVRLAPSFSNEVLGYSDSHLFLYVLSWVLILFDG